MKKRLSVLAILLCLSLIACSRQPSSSQSGGEVIPGGGSPASASGSVPEPSPQEPPSAESGPEEPSAPEEDPPFEKVPPDPGAGIPDPGPTEAQRRQVEDMAEYLEKNLDPWDYSEIWRFFGPDGSGIQIVTPFPDAVKKVVEAYTGEAVPVEYFSDQFSKGQLEQAKSDLERFLEEHPEIGIWDWRPILLFGGYQIELKEKSDALTEFIETYSIPGIYQADVCPDGPPMHPD